MHMNNIKVTNPYLAFIAIPLVIAIVVGFFLLPKYKRKSTKNLISLGLHFLMVATLTLTFIDIRFLHTSENTEMVILADCSESTRENIDTLDSTISDIYNQGKEKGYKVGVVAFASSGDNIVKIGDSYRSGKIKDVFESDSFDKTSTDIKTALDYSKDLFSENSVKRLVLVSDGKETDDSAIDSIESLINSSITVDAVLLDSKEGDEIAITGLEYTDHCFLNKPQTAKVSIYSHSQTTAKIELLSGGEIKQSKDVDLAKGMSVYSFDLPSDQVGTFKYDVKVTPLTGNTDKYEENNQKSFEQDFTDEIKVLLLSNTSADLNAIKAMNLYTDKAKIDAYYSTSEYPYTLEEFMKYDEIILSDVNISEIGYSDEFVANLNTAVKYYGKSLITYGATYSAASGDYVKTYNDMLPVQYESDEPKALILLIDVSYSMEGDKLKQAKAGAIACLDLLGEKDYIGVVTFSDNTNVVVGLTSAKNRSAITSRINKITVQGSTTMKPGLVKCDEMLSGSDFEFKNVICLSDGLPFDDEKDLRTQVYKMAAKNISVSFINIACNQKEAIKLLTTLAQYGNGAYYYASSASTVIRIIESSVSEEITNKAIEEDTTIQVHVADDGTLKDVDTSGFTSIGGYNYCRMKTLSTTVLTVQYQTDSDFSKVMTIPLYAYWDFGNGRVSSFTSSLSGSWTKNFRSKEAGVKFFQNATNESLPKRKTVNNMDFTYTTKGKSTDVVLTSNDGDKTATVKIEVTAPDQSVASYDLIFDGTSYISTINTSIIGEYTVKLSYKGSAEGSKEESYSYPLFFDYSSEFDTTNGVDNTLLYNLSKQNGNYYKGSYKLELLDSELQFRSYNSSMLWFLLATVIIFLIDVLVRKSDFKKKKKQPKIKDVGSFN